MCSVLKMAKANAFQKMILKYPHIKVWVGNVAVDILIIITSIKSVHSSLLIAETVFKITEQIHPLPLTTYLSVRYATLDFMQNAMLQFLKLSPAAPPHSTSHMLNTQPNLKIHNFQAAPSAQAAFTKKWSKSNPTNFNHQKLSHRLSMTICHHIHRNLFIRSTAILS